MEGPDKLPDKPQNLHNHVSYFSADSFHLQQPCLRGQDTTVVRGLKNSLTPDMKLMGFGWRQHLKNLQERKVAKESPIASSTLPTLPYELWCKIIGFVVRIAGSTSIGLNDPFTSPHVHEEYPNIDPTLFEDRNSVSLVCSWWNRVVTEILFEYLVIYTGKQLEEFVKKLELKPVVNGKCLGPQVTRIDFCIGGRYEVEHVVRLLQCTPNIIVYTNCNGPPDFPANHTPLEIIDALVANCRQSLKRVQWSRLGELPRYCDLVTLCNGLPNLTTLRLLAVHSYPSGAESLPPILLLPKLKTLSLGFIPDPPDRPHSFLLTWDLFLGYIASHSFQLPSLERFECDIFPLLSILFFYLHGSKLRLFRTTSWSAEHPLPITLTYCPNLQSLVIIQGSEMRMMLPRYHPSIRQICILPPIEVEVDVPNKVYETAIMHPLESLLNRLELMSLPKLKEVRVCNSGSYYKVVDYYSRMYIWWIRWNLRGVLFSDKTGTGWKDIHINSSETLLNTVRG